MHNILLLCSFYARYFNFFILSHYSEIDFLPAEDFNEHLISYSKAKLLHIYQFCLLLMKLKIKAPHALFAAIIDTL